MKRKNSIVINGLKVTTGCNYIKFTEAKFLNINEDLLKSVYTIEFPKGFHSKDVISKHIELIEDKELTPTQFIRIKNPLINLNGIEFYKLTSDSINFSQFITKDIDDFEVSLDEGKVTILIPEKRLDDINTYKKCIESIPYFELSESCNLPDTLSNLYNVNLTSNDFKSELSNKFVFSSKKYYDRYILRMIDILESFITKLEGVLEDSGIKLMGLPNDEFTETSDRIMYRITELGEQTSHKSDSNELRYAVSHRSTISFELTTSNFILFNDFKTRYQNLDFVSNFTEFYTKDAYGMNWISNVEWRKITTDFNQDYGVDTSGNFAYTAAFECDLHYYVVFDETFSQIGEIVTYLLDDDKLINTIKIKY